MSSSTTLLFLSSWNCHLLVHAAGVNSFLQVGFAIQPAPSNLSWTYNSESTYLLSLWKFLWLKSLLGFRQWWIEDKKTKSCCSYSLYHISQVIVGGINFSKSYYVNYHIFIWTYDPNSSQRLVDKKICVSFTIHFITIYYHCTIYFTENISSK